MRFRIAVALALIGIASGAHAQGGVTGIWEVTIDSPQGATSVDVTFKQEGTALAGSMSSPVGDVDFKGTVVDNALNAAYSLDLQGNVLEITMTGKVAGDAMTGVMTIGGLGEIPWTAKRKGAAPTAPTATPAAAAAPAAATTGAKGDASGKWDIMLSLGGVAEIPMTATFQQAGEAVTGTLSSQAGEMPVKGTMVGRALTLQFTAQTPQGDMSIVMTGNLGADDAFVGKTAIAGMGEADWTGKRSK